MGWGTTQTAPDETACRNIRRHFSEDARLASRPGRNTVMVKAVLSDNSPRFYASLGDCPIEQGYDLARFGLYSQAADALAVGLAGNLGADVSARHFHACHLMVALAAGDTAEYRTRAAELWNRFQNSDDPTLLSFMCSLSPEGMDDPRRLVQFSV